MSVKRIVANVTIDDPARVHQFYRTIFGLDLAMDMTWIRTYTAPATMQVQVSFMSEGGSGTPVPDLSVEVEDVADVLRRVEDAGIDVEYGPVSEPWGVRRFFIRDPAGKLINVLQHEPT